MKTNKISIFIINSFLLLLSAYPLSAAPVPDTGQTVCYDNSTEIACPSSGADFYGQDASYLINPPSYTKLDANGNDLPDSATEWAMVRDNVTGLIWEVKTNDGTVHDRDNTYTWYDSNPATNGGNAGSQGDGTDTEDFLRSLNSGNFGGYTDWRLPTIKELTFILDYSSYPRINTAIFPNFQYGNYWSATITSNNYNDAFMVDIGSGNINSGSKSNSRYVIAVRGRVFSNRFIDNGDGTVTDKATGLMWLKQTDAVKKTWIQALSYAETLETAGYSDWRVPTAKELVSIIDYTRTFPAFTQSLFTLPSSDGYIWTGTNNPNTSAYYVTIQYGTMWSDMKTNGNSYVLAVRGGQKLDTGKVEIGSPRSGDLLGIGRTYNTTWDATELGTMVNILLSREGGKTGSFSQLMGATENDGEWQWTVNVTESYNCVIRVEPVDNTAAGNNTGLFSVLEVVPENIDMPFHSMILGGQSNSFLLTVTAVDGTLDLTSEITSWTSSNEAVATVESSGIVTAVGEGRCTISAVYEEYTVEEQIDVIAAPSAQEAEPNDDNSSANPLSRAVTIYGVLQDGNDIDTFEITSAQQEKGRLEWLMNGFNSSAMLTIKDSSGAVIKETMVYGGAWNRAIVQLPAGSSFVSIKSFSGTYGEYLIRYEFLVNSTAGQKLWDYPAGGSSVPTVAGDLLYFTSGNSVYCVEKSSGRLIWDYDTSNYISNKSPLVVNGRVYVANYYNLFCLDALNGGKIWDVSIGGENCYSSPAYANGRIYIARRYDQDSQHFGRIYCLDAETGLQKWDYETSGYIYGSPTIADGMLFIGAEFISNSMSYGKIYTLDAMTGQRLKEYLTGKPIMSAPAYRDGTVYVTCQDGKIYAINAATNSLKWSFNTGSSFGSGSPSVKGDRIYAATNSYLFCLDRNTGAELWRAPFGSSSSSPAIAGNKVYITNGMEVRCFDAGYGDYLWGYSGMESTGVAVSDGKVYITGGMMSSKLYCTDAGDPSADGWGMYQHDVSHSGDGTIIREGLYGARISSPLNGLWLGGESGSVQLRLWGMYIDGFYDDTASATGWTSGNGSVLTVDGSGKITAVGEGRAVVTASLGGYQAAIEIKVSAIPTISEAESNDTIATANILTEGAPVYGKITSTADKDFFKFTLSDTQKVRIELLINGYTVPANLKVTDQEGTQFALLTVRGGDVESCVVELFAGTSYVILDTTSLAAPGEYTLRYEILTGADAGTKVWEYTTGSAARSTPTVMGGSLFVGTDNGELQCINTTSGGKIWGYNTGGAISSSPMIYEGKVYVGSQNGKVVAVNLTTGQKVWEFSIGDATGAIQWWSTAAISGGRLFIGSINNKLYCLNVETGEKIWSYTTGGAIYSSPAIWNSRVYFGSDDDKVYCLDTANGTLLWTYATTGDVQSSPAVAGGVVYIGNNNGRVYAFDGVTGVKIWDNSTYGSVSYISPAVGENRVYFGGVGTDGRMYCLDRKTGRRLWISTSMSISGSSPAIADGKLYIGSNDGKIYTIDMISGTRLWSYNTGTQIQSSPIIYEGKVYVANNSGKITCLRTGDDGTDGWQMYRHDLEHRGDASIQMQGFSGISLAKTDDHLTLQGLNQQIQLAAYGDYLDGSYEMTGEIQGWESSNTLVATVDSTGRVTAVGAGTAVITATYGAFTNTIDVVVEEKEGLTEAEPNEDSATATLLTAGETFYGAIETATDKDVFRIDVPESQKVRLEVIFNRYLHYTDIQVMDKDGVLISQFTPASVMWDRRIITLAQGANTVHITSTSGASGEYLIQYHFICNEYGGDIKWEVSGIGGVSSSPTLSGGKIYVPSGGKIMAFDAVSGVKLWEYSSPACSTNSSILAKGDRLYVHTGCGVFCLEAESGSVIWHNSNINTAMGTSTPSLYEDRLYVATYNYLVCLNVKNGEKLWEQRVYEYIESASPMVIDGRVYIGTNRWYLEENRGIFYCFDAESGEKIWEFTQERRGNIGYFSPSSDGRYVIAGFRDDHVLYCLDASTGEIQWSFSPYNAVYSASIVEGKVLFSTGEWSGQTYCLDLETGGVIWQRYHNANEAYIRTAPTYSQGKVYVAMRDEKEATNGKVECLDLETGTLLWEKLLTGRPNYSSAIISEGNIYVATTDGRIYCMDAGDPDADGWTQFQHDLQNSGNHLHSRIGEPVYHVSASPVEEMEVYRLYLVAEYEDGNHNIECDWVSSDPAIADFDENTITGLQNGRVEVSTEYDGTVFKKVLYFQPSFESYETLYNDSMDGATLIGEGEFIMGEVLQDDADFYRFDVEADSLVEFSFSSYSSIADTRVQILDSTGTMLGEITSADGRERFLRVGLAPGAYYAKLTSNGDIDQNEFYCVTYYNIGTPLERVTQPLHPGESGNGSLWSVQDTGLFTFSLEEKSGVKVSFTPEYSEATYKVELLNAYGDVVDQTSSLYGNQACLEAVYGAGEYTVRISSLGRIDADAQFTLGVDLSDVPLEEELNDTYLAASPFSIGSIIKGRLSSPEDIDFYEFSIDAPRFLNLGLSVPDSYRDFRILLYKESDEGLINGVDVKRGEDVVLPIGISAGRYYISVSGLGTDIDTLNYYTLSLEPSENVNVEIESNNTIKFANSLSKEMARKGRIFSGSDIDCYGFYLPEGGIFTVDFTPETTTGDYLIEFVNANDEVDYLKYSNNGVPARVTVNPTPGNYFVKIRSGGDLDQYLSYTVSLEADSENFEIVGIKSLVSLTIAGDTDDINTGETLQLRTIANYSDATSEIISGAIWESLDSTVATTNSTGLITAKGEGSTTIVATHGGVTGQYSISVGTPTLVYEQHHGNLILVAGGGVATDNTLKESTQYLADLAYKRFRSRLFRDEDIYYLNPMTWHDINGDGYDDGVVDDSSPTVIDFGNTINTWASSRDTDGPLYIYLIDHGGIDKFNIFPNEIMTASQLKTYLDQFQQQTGRKVVVVIEACKSGSFTDNLATSEYDRVVVTSTDNQNAYMDLDGSISFSQFFLDALHAGESVMGGFLKAGNRLQNMGLPYSLMVPQLSSTTTVLADNTYVGGSFVIAGLEPQFSDWTDSGTAQANQDVSFFATLVDLEDIERVWAVVIPPGYTSPDVAEDLQAPVVDLPRFDLTDEDMDGTYTGVYSGFVYNDVYTITFYASNTEGSVTVSPSIEITVEGGTGLDTDRDGMPNDWEDNYLCVDRDVADGDLNPDGDGLTNYQEYQYGTNPCNGDTDADGMDDGWEVSWGFNPKVADGHLDADEDGVTNYRECLDGTSPLDKNSFKDHVLPQVTGVFPVEGELNAAKSTAIQIYFSEAMNTGLININQVAIVGEVSGTHLGTISYDAVNHRLTVMVNAPFEYSEQVDVTVSRDITDVAGNPLDGNENGVDDGTADNYHWWFLVVESPAVTPPNPYDVNQDWVIGDFELLDAIDAWASGEMAGCVGAGCDVDFYMLDLIDLWKAGSYEYLPESQDECFPWAGM